MRILPMLILFLISNSTLASSRYSEYLTQFESSSSLKEIRILGNRILMSFDLGYQKNIRNPKSLLGFDYIFDNFAHHVKQEGRFFSGVELATAYNKFIMIDSQFKDKHKHVQIIRESQAIHVGFMLLIKKGRLMTLDNLEVFDNLATLMAENLGTSSSILSYTDKEKPFWGLSWKMIHIYFRGFPIDSMMFAQQDLWNLEPIGQKKPVLKLKVWQNKIMASFAEIFYKYDISKPLNSFWGSKVSLELRVLKRSLGAVNQLEKQYRKQKILALLHRKSLEANRVLEAKYYEKELKKIWLNDKRKAIWGSLKNINSNSAWYTLKEFASYLILLFVQLTKNLTLVFITQILLFGYFFRKSFQNEQLTFSLKAYRSQSTPRRMGRIKRLHFICIQFISSVKGFTKSFFKKTWQTFISTDHLNIYEKSFHTIMLVSLGYSFTQLDQTFHEEFMSHLNYINDRPF